MHVVVTGGAGFLGSYFTRSLVEGRYPSMAGARVTVLDALTYAGSLEALSDVLDQVTFVHADVCDVSVVADVVDGADLVVHFAAQTHVDRSIEAGASFVTTNLLGTQTILEAAVKRAVGRVVVVSTDEVYGPRVSGASREHDPLRPSSPYSATKAGADLLALAYARTHGLDVCITRGSNTYGPFQHAEKAVPRFTTSLLEGEPATVYGDGRHVREWLHASDHCAGIHLVAERGTPGGVYNVGGGHALTNRELAEHLLHLTGRRPTCVVAVADRPGHDRRYSLAWERLAALGYTPAVPFDEGLRDTVDWYRHHRGWWEQRRWSRRGR